MFATIFIDSWMKKILLIEMEREEQNQENATDPLNQQHLKGAWPAAWNMECDGLLINVSFKASQRGSQPRFDSDLPQ